MGNEKSSVEFDFFVFDFPIYFYNMFFDIFGYRDMHIQVVSFISDVQCVTTCSNFNRK